MRLLFGMIIGLLLFASCNKNSKEYAPMQNALTGHKAKVIEVLETGSYTYLNVAENGQKFWMAVGSSDVKEGQEIYYDNAMEMVDFRSKDLDRTFDRILFVDEVSTSPLVAKPKVKTIPNDSVHQHREVEKKPEEVIEVEVAKGGITIGDLFKNRQNHENKKVLIRGKVVKINNGIMDRNWVHLKDGTSDNGKSDLTFTTQEEVAVGDVVTFEGTVSLNKEYGAGYVYDIVVESAVLK